MTVPEFTINATLSDQLYEHLESAIIDGALAPGSRLHADEVAERFDVSRIPVREAFRALAAEGWIDIRPRRHTVVARQSDREYDDLTHARRLIGAEVARLAARHRTEADLRVLDQVVADNQLLLAATDLTELARNNEAFHVAIAVASGNTVLVDMVRRIEKRNRWYFVAAFPVTGEVAVDDHRALVDAIRAQDANAAVQLAQDHVDRWASVVLPPT